MGFHETRPYRHRHIVPRAHHHDRNEENRPRGRMDRQAASLPHLYPSQRLRSPFTHSASSAFCACSSVAT